MMDHVYLLLDSNSPVSIRTGQHILSKGGGNALKMKYLLDFRTKNRDNWCVIQILESATETREGDIMPLRILFRRGC